MRIACNIDKKDRINRTVIGIFLCLAALLGAGKSFYLILGGVLIVEGLIGWCSIPYASKTIKQIFQNFSSKKSK